MDFVLLVLKLCHIQVVISLPLWIKLPMGHLLLFFPYNFSSFLSYVGSIVVTNHFSLFLIDKYILAIQQIITLKEHLRYSFWSAAAIFWTASEPLAPWHKKKWLKQTQIHFHRAIPHKSRHSSLLWCMLCTTTPDISRSSKNIISTARVSKLPLCLWLCSCTDVLISGSLYMISVFTLVKS